MIIIVTGMHRSGTSAMAGVLNSNKVYMGEGHWHPPPMKENPKGFFENNEFRVVNDQLLRENNYNVKSFDPSVPDYNHMQISDTVERQMANLIIEYSTNPNYEHWGFKDPRTCLTLGFWLQAIEVIGGINYKVILMYRNNLDISLSMAARGDKGGLGRLAVLAGNYYKAIRKHHHDFIEVQYNDLMYHPAETTEEIGGVLGIPLPDIGHIDHTLANRADPVLSDHQLRKDSHANRC